MLEPTPPRNRDRDIPPRTGDDMGRREPPVPLPGPEPHERRPREEETYQREEEKKRSDEETTSSRR